MSVVKISTYLGNIEVVPCTTVDVKRSLAQQDVQGADESNISISVDAEVDELE